jgi:hypothetical protein
VLLPCVTVTQAPLPRLLNVRLSASARDGSINIAASAPKIQKLFIVFS